VSRLEAGPVFVVELLDEGRWCPTGFLTQDENVGWELIEGQPGDLYRLVRVDSWRWPSRTWRGWWSRSSASML